jgi:hypothetical protein
MENISSLFTLKLPTKYFSSASSLEITDRIFYFDVSVVFWKFSCSEYEKQLLM